MTKPPGSEAPPSESHPDEGFDHGWEAHKRRQATAGLALTPAQRLRWLEETMETLRRWQGRARNAPRVQPPD